MPNHQAQVRLGTERSSDLVCQIIHDIQERGIRLHLVGDERPAQFEENKLLQGSILSHSRGSGSIIPAA